MWWQQCHINYINSVYISQWLSRAQDEVRYVVRLTPAGNTPELPFIQQVEEVTVNPNSIEVLRMQLQLHLHPHLQYL